MKIHLTVQYNTSWGERLELVVGKRRLEMKYGFGGIWERDLTLRDLPFGAHFGFELLRGGEVLRREWRSHCFVCPPAAAKGPDRSPRLRELTLRCAWLDRPSDSVFYTKAFTDVIFRRPELPASTAQSAATPENQVLSGNVSFISPAAQLRPGESLAMVGTGPLGNWDRPLRMDDGNFPWWQASVNATEPFAFKFVIIDTASGEILQWEDGPDHRFAEIPPKAAHLVVADLFPSFARKPWKGAGVAVPVFSLRTERSFGVGEFMDLKPLADFAAETGMHLIQLLPINDTTNSHSWEDSYPYNAISSFALHPMYISLEAAGVKPGKAYLKEKAALEAEPRLDYVKVNNLKEKYLRGLFAARGREDMDTPQYRAFEAANKYWLKDYADFCAGRDSLEPEFYRWVQYLLDFQLKEAVAYVHSKGVAIKGDLPIGVSRDSVDALKHPELFHMDSQAGAPPDAFSADGQNWGFPTYNWEKMAQDGFAWWKARLGKMAEYFDAYRIDHILGFFRIWEIPLPFKSGLMGHFSPALPYSTDELRGMGYDPQDGTFIEDPRRKGWWHPRIDGPKTELYEDFFYHRHNAFWKESAMGKLLPLTESTRMLPCGEDLGMIPSCVPETVSQLGILSLEIQRMPKSFDAFGRPETYPYASVAATGTHDMSPLRAWWEEDHDLSQRFYNEILGLEGDAPYFLEPRLADLILAEHMASSSILTILPLQDYLAAGEDVRYEGNPSDERINVPAIPRFYWRYRLHRSLESIMEDKNFCAHIRSLIKDNGR